MMSLPPATRRRVPPISLVLALLAVAVIVRGQQHEPVLDDAHSYAPATQPTTEPTTLPALSPADLALLKKLETGTWRDRRAAADQLKNLDDSVYDNHAELTLRAMLAQTKNAEARARLNAALTALADNRLIGPSLITMHYTDAPAQQVFHELFRQARWPLHLAPSDPLESDSPHLTVNVDHQPFWKVFPALAARAGLGVGSTDNQTFALLPGQSMPDGPADVEGPFMTVASMIAYNHNIALSPDQNGSSVSFTLQLSLFAEPKMQILAVSPQVNVIEAVDDHGNSLLPDAPPPLEPGDVGGPPYGMTANLKFPTKNPGTRLARFRGSAIATVQTASKRIEISDPLNAKPRPITIGKSVITFVSCRDHGDNYNYTLTFTASADLQINGAIDRITRGVHIYDAAGKELSSTSGGNSEDNNLTTITLDFAKANAPDAKPAGTPAKLVLDITAATRDLTVPIQFKDLDMNILGEQ